MKNCVLFTAIGGTDPISNEHDGAFLHICRVYKPQKIYMYMSSEMWNHHKIDNRYCYCLDKLYQKLHRNVDCKIIAKPNLTEVQLFDNFYFEFQGIINQIREENPGSQILLNISSGTPAMKSTIMILSTLNEKDDLLTIQVSTPQKSQNPHVEDKDNYDSELYWEFNKDNEDNFENRCIEHKSVNLTANIRTEVIIRHIQSYDYVAALEVAHSIEKFITPEAMNLLNLAVCRVQLNQGGVDKLMKKEYSQLLPVIQSGHRRIFEYICWLQIKNTKQQYSDFLRGLTPIIMELFELYLKNNLNFNVLDYCEKRGNIYFLTRNLLAKDMIGQKVLDALDSEYERRRRNRFTDVIYTSEHLCMIITALAVNKEELKEIADLRNVESKARNFAAHTMVEITEDWIIERVDMTPTQILTKLKKLTGWVGIACTKEQWKIYDTMNQLIISNLR